MPYKVIKNNTVWKSLWSKDHFPLLKFVDYNKEGKKM